MRVPAPVPCFFSSKEPGAAGSGVFRRPEGGRSGRSLSALILYENAAERSGAEGMPGDDGEEGSGVVEHAFHASGMRFSAAGNQPPEGREEQESGPFQIALRHLEVDEKRAGGLGTEPKEKCTAFLLGQHAQTEAAHGERFIAVRRRMFAGTEHGQSSAARHGRGADIQQTAGSGRKGARFHEGKGAPCNHVCRKGGKKDGHQTSTS